MMPDQQFDAIVIGAGVIGLAIARAVALTGRSVLVVERAEHFGTETSSRNSEVIHAGIYYLPASLKARLCSAGNAALYAFCEAHGVPFRRCGKLIVAADEAQISQLEAIEASAKLCGVHDLQLIDAADAKRMEPELACVAALYSPSTGIVDTHSYMQSLIGEAEAHDAIFVFHTEVTGILPAPEGWSIAIGESDDPVASAKVIINAAGLSACTLASRIEGFPTDCIPLLRLAKGCYFGYGRRTSFQHLIYPLPEPGGLGIHLTLDMAGRVRFGPDVEWIEQVDYSVDPHRRHRFAQAIHRYWPGLDPQQLYPDYAGVRPKLSGPGDPPADFMVSTPADHGVAGIINLFGIESPGITASLPLADYVSRQVALAA